MATRRAMTAVAEDPGGPSVPAEGLVRPRWRPSLSLTTDPLFRSAYALILSTVASSAFGVAYWILAARLYPPRVLGQESAAISTMLMLSNFAQMNLFFTLTRFVPTAGRATGRLIGYAYTASGALALLLGAAFVLVAPAMSHQLSLLFAGPVMVLGFVLGVGLWCVFSLQDGVLTALRRTPWVPVENALFGLVKLALLLVFATLLVSGGIFASWTIPVLLAVVPVNLLVYRRLIPARADSPMRFPFKRVARFAAVDYVSSLFVQSYTTALPLVIVATLGAKANANFYVAYVVIAAVDLVSQNLATSLLVESAHDEARLSEYARRVLRRGVSLLLPVVLLIELGAPYFLQIFGHRYADGSTTLLRLLALATLPRMLNIIYVGTMRAQHRVGRVVVTQLAISALVLSLTFATVSGMGVTGVGMAWLCAHVAMAIALLPWLRRTLREAG
jgi:O-antigen/teichoic acid export membrane protein